MGWDTPPGGWHALEVREVTRRLGTSPSGLDAGEVASRLGRYGPNKLPEEPPTPWWIVLVRQFGSPLITILLIAAVVTLVMGDHADAAVIAAVLVLNATIGFVQERRAEASVRSLQTLVTPSARVVREGLEREIPSADLVPGDVVVVETGNRIPADLRLEHVNGLRVDESLLTGESLPVAKSTGPVAADTPVADRSDLSLSGTVVTSGRGRGYVVATGEQTALGRLATEVGEERSPATPVQERMARLGRLIAVVVAVAALATFAAGVAIGERASDMFAFAVAMAVSAVPEGLPVVLTITLALGVRRMAERRAVIRRLPAVETLGSTTVIGTDKTGTLTENRMAVLALWSGGDLRSADDPELRALAADEDTPVAQAVAVAAIVNEGSVWREGDELRSRGDPLDVALLRFDVAVGQEPEAIRDAHEVVAEIPFESERRYAATVTAREGRHHLFVKGAPERVVQLCDSVLVADGPVGLDDGWQARIGQATRELAAAGLRVIALAEGERAEPPVLPDGSDLPEGGLRFVGLAGMEDPPRPGVAEAVAGCRRAGIRPIMITGDHLETAVAIAGQVNIATRRTSALTGPDLDRMDDDELGLAVGEVDVFARVAPEHKLRIVEALRGRDEVVAVTGDGVNDAPALRAADIGVAMGRGGTDVAREAADMVLTDDDFSTIYAAVGEGRVTFDNIRKATFFLLSTGAAELVVLFGALVAGWPLLLLPTQILWLNLVTNGVQDVALGFEPAEPGLTSRAPRPRREGVMDRVLWVRLLLVGATMAAGTGWAFRWELDSSGSVELARTAALITMVLFQILHLGNCRSERASVFEVSLLSNRFLLLATAVVLAIQVAVLYLPATQYLLHLEPLGPGAWVRAAGVASSVIVVSELHKLWLRRS